MREGSGQAIVAEIENKSAQIVLDPVFLHDKSFWNEVAVPYKKSYDHYLFYYNLMSSIESDKAARRIADHFGLKLVVMTVGNILIKAADILRDVGPEEFLYLISHADFVVTDSFHGVAFSIIFQKQFVFSDTSVGTNGRGMELLERLEIDNLAYCQSYSADKKIDYMKVKEPLERYIREAYHYLDCAIAGK